MTQSIPHPTPPSSRGSEVSGVAKRIVVPETADLGRIWAQARVIDLVGGRVVDPDGPLNRREGLRIVDGRLVEPGSQPDLQTELRIDLKGGLITPGLADMHVHLREPGNEDAETIASGLLAAARGGFTRVACMPNTNPPVDQRAIVELIHARAKESCGVHLHPIAAVTKGLKSNNLTEMAELKEAGVTAVSNDGFPVFSSRTMRRAMEYAKTFDLLVISHAEDDELKGEGVMNEGYWSTVLGLRGIPAAAEEIAVMRDIALSRLTGCRLHIAHVSTAGSVDAIRRAKTEGLPVTAETAPHYFTLTQAALQSYDANFKMNPPLRTERDVEAILQGIVDGTLDVIATDHAPHTQENKEVEIDQAPFGIIGLECSLGLVVTHLLRPGRIGVEDLVRLMCQRAARIMGWDSGHLRPGEPAELTLIDPQKTWTVDPGLFASKSRNCPFKGWELQGRAALTVVEGRLVHWENVRAEADSGLLAKAL